MGCEKHPVHSVVRFLDEHVEPFTGLPLTRWQRLTAWDVIVAAVIFAAVFGEVFRLMGL
jgi:hypothetical protein